MNSCWFLNDMGISSEETSTVADSLHWKLATAVVKELQLYRQYTAPRQEREGGVVSPRKNTQQILEKKEPKASMPPASFRRWFN
jgi:hypothetical protein